MNDREREAETQAEGKPGSMEGVQCGTRSRVSRIMPWAEGGTKPLSNRGCPILGILLQNNLQVLLSDMQVIMYKSQ